MEVQQKKKKLTERQRTALLLGGGLGAMLAGGAVHDFVPKQGTKEERKALLHLKLEMLSHGVRPTFFTVAPAHFNPGARTTTYPAFATRTGLHEYGHSTMYRNSLLGALRRANMSRFGYGLLGTPLWKIGLLTQAGPTKDSGKRGAILGGALAFPALAEESIANLQVARKIIKANGAKGIAPAVKYLAAMTPALSTYAGRALMMVGAGYGAGKLREHLVKKYHQASTRNHKK